MADCRKKGQGGLEFMILIIFTLIVFTSYNTIINNNSADVVEAKRNYLSISIAEKIAYEINIAMTSGPGYMKRFYIPYDIYGYDYNITFSRNSAFVDWAGNSHAAYLITNNISGDFIKGYNYIENRGGSLYMNPAYTQVPAVTISKSPAYPKPDDNITLTIISDDTYTGNMNIDGCHISDDEVTWNYTAAFDGAYDEPYESAQEDIGNLSTGTYTYYARCNDSDGYIGYGSLTFSVSTQGSLWWNADWPYRIAVNITGEDYARYDYPVRVRINFTQMLSDLGDSNDFDADSIRIVEWNDTLELNFETAANSKEITRIDISSPDLWDMTADTSTRSIDFTSGLNQTGNTWGISGSDDGWDWTNSSSLAPYGHNAGQANYFAIFGDPDGDSDFDTDVGSGALNPDLPADSSYIAVIIGNMADDPNTGEEILDSGAWGIRFYVTADMYSALQDGGWAVLLFDYYADDLDDDLEEGAWIKARFGNSTSMNYLGSDLDTDRAYSDTTPDIWVSVDDPNNGWDDLVSGVFEDYVTEYITGEGWYYLDLGGKVDWVDSDSNGHTTTEGLGAYFDNIELMIKKETSLYNESTNATLDVFWMLEGATEMGETRNYYMYFNSENISNNASTIAMDYDVQFFHVGYYYSNSTKMENALQSLEDSRWLSDWSMTNTGTVSPNLKESNIGAGKNAVILGQSDSPTFNFDSWMQKNNMMIIFTPSKDLTTDLPIAGYSSSNHQKYDDLETTIYTHNIESELKRNSMSYGYIDQGGANIYAESCVEADEGDSQVMISACDYYGGFISFTNYPSTASEASAYPSAPERILEQFIWKLLFQRKNMPAISLGDAVVYGG